MAILRFWRQAQRRARRMAGPNRARRRGAAPMMPDPGLSAPARRVNRLVAVVALFGALGTVALAVALTPGAQTSASSAGALQANAVQAPLQISRIDVPPAPVETVRAETTVVAARPEPAPKGDRLVRSYRAPPPTRADRADSSEPPRGTQSLRGTGGEDSSRHPIAMLPQEPVAVREAADSAERKLEEEDVHRVLEFGLAASPAPGVDDAREDAVNEAIGEAVEASAEAAREVSEEDIDEAVEAAVEQAVPQPAPKPEPATRAAAVRTDVNMRARPSNGGAVIQVVPGKATVEIIGCDYWCEVIYDGRRGYIYKGFVRGS